MDVAKLRRMPDVVVLSDVWRRNEALSDAASVSHCAT
jgi:hypothetical protein